MNSNWRNSLGVIFSCGFCNYSRRVIDVLGDAASPCSHCRVHNREQINLNGDATIGGFEQSYKAFYEGNIDNHGRSEGGSDVSE